MDVAVEPEALLISGTVGSGKTTAAEAVGNLLRDRGVPHAVLDLDELRRYWPSPPGDRFNQAVELINLSAVAATYLRAGAVRLVLAGVVEDGASRVRYARSVGVRLHVARLQVELPLVRRRLTARHAGLEAELDWHLHRCGELDEILTVAGVEDFAVQASRLGVDDVAGALMAGAGWDDLPTPP